MLQAPNGIKRYLNSLVDSLEEAGAETILSASHTWGGCDVALNELGAVGADALVHVGHYSPVRFTPPSNVLFVPGLSSVDALEVVERAADELLGEGVRKVGVFTTTQHLHELGRALSALSERGLEAFTASSPDLAMREGLVTGCDARAAERLAGSVDALLVVAGGKFHALGVALATGVRTVAADPFTRTAFWLDEDARRTISLRLYHLFQALEAREALLVLSKKPGQKPPREVLRQALELLARRGFKVRVAVFGDVERGVLEDFGGANLFINAACPRLATDSPHLFPKPVVNLTEILYVLENGLGAFTPSLSVCPAHYALPSSRRLA